MALGEKQKIQTNLNEVKQRKVRVQQGITSLKRFDEDLVAKKKSVVAGINQHFDELSKVMEAKRRDLIEKATAVTSSKQKQIQAQREQLEMALASCESSIEFTEQAFKNGNDVQVLSMQKYILLSLEDLKRVKDQTQPCVTEDMTFAISMSVKDIGNKLFNGYAVDDVVASPGNCKASFTDEPNPPRLKIGKPSTIAIVCYDKYNKRVKHGGQVIKPTISGVEVSDVTVNNNNDGSHTVSFSPRQGGMMKFEVTINGRPTPSCSLTKDVKWGFSIDRGNGEITNNGLTMEGKSHDGTYCWRMGECSFVSGVHTWKAQANSATCQEYYGRRNRNTFKSTIKYTSCKLEVGVIDSSEVNTLNNKWVHRGQVRKLSTFTLVLDMESRKLTVYPYDLGEELDVGSMQENGNQNNSVAIFQITAERVYPFFSLYHNTATTNYSISIIE